MESVSLHSILKNSIKTLSDAGVSTPELDAEVLTAHILGIERYQLITEQKRSLSGGEITLIDGAIERRKKREPVAYITGKKEFYALEFEVTPHVLIPRPETELLVDLALYHAPQNGEMLDLCTGSGAIAVAVKYNRKDLRVTASDVSPDALNVAKRNADRILGKGQIVFVESDLFTAFSGRKFNLIVTNPPYILRNDAHKLEKELSYEPELALFTENHRDGIVDRIINECCAYLAADGVMIMEIGHDMKEFVESAGLRNLFFVTVTNDFAGNPRVATFLRK
jgi:release factor glutamine methyltransferase